MFRQKPKYAASGQLDLIGLFLGRPENIADSNGEHVGAFWHYAEVFAISGSGLSSYFWLRLEPAQKMRNPIQ